MKIPEFNTAQELLEELNKTDEYTQLLKDKIEEQKKIFFEAIKNDDLIIIKRINEWNIPTEYLSTGNKLDISFSYLDLDIQTTRYLITKGNKLFSKKFLTEVNSIFYSLQYNSIYNKVTEKIKYADMLQLTLQTTPQYFEKNFLNSVIKFWGKFCIDKQEHSFLVKYITERHPDILNTFKMASASQHKKQIDTFLSIPEYKNAYDSVIEKSMFFNECIVSTLTRPHIEILNFWIEQSGSCELDKKGLSEFISQGFKHKNEGEFFTCLDKILESTPIYQYQHIIFRTALSNAHYETCHILLQKYLSEDVEYFNQLRPILDKKMVERANHLDFKHLYQEYETYCKTINLYHKINQLPEQKSQPVKFKI